jgi:hypothetical protein
VLSWGISTSGEVQGGDADPQRSVTLNPRRPAQTHRSTEVVGCLRQEVSLSLLVLGGVGYPQSGTRPMMWRLEAVPAANTSAWQGFLTALTGRAELVVTDGGSAVTRAIAAAWPDDRLLGYAAANGTCCAG